MLGLMLHKSLKADQQQETNLTAKAMESWEPVVLNVVMNDDQ